MLSEWIPTPPSRPLVKYYLYSATAWGGFHLPIDVLLLEARGLTFGQIGLLVAIGSAVTLLAEIPTGYIGDRIGRRNSLLVSSTLMTIGSLSYAVVGSFPAFIGAKIAFMLGVTFRSGTTSAWLYDLLDARGREDEFARISGRGRTGLLVVLGVTSVVGGYLGEYSYGLAYLATATLTTVSFLVVVTMSEPPRSGENDDTLTVESAIATIRTELVHPEIRPVVFALGIFFGVATTVNAVFVQPVATEVGVAVGELGWFFAGLTGVGAIASYASGWVEERATTEWWLVGVPLVLGSIFAGIAFFPVVALPAFFLLRGGQRITQSLAGQYLNDRIGSASRATTLSVVAMVYSVFGIPIRVGTGYLADVLPVTTAVAVVGSVLLVGGTYFYFKLVFGHLEVGDTKPAME